MSLHFNAEQRRFNRLLSTLTKWLELRVDCGFPFWNHHVYLFFPGLWVLEETSSLPWAKRRKDPFDANKPPSDVEKTSFWKTMNSFLGKTWQLTWKWEDIKKHQTDGRNFSQSEHGHSCTILRTRLPGILVPTSRGFRSPTATPTGNVATWARAEPLAERLSRRRSSREPNRDLNQDWLCGSKKTWRKKQQDTGCILNKYTHTYIYTYVYNHSEVDRIWDFHMHFHFGELFLTFPYFSYYIYINDIYDESPETIDVFECQPPPLPPPALLFPPRDAWKFSGFRRLSVPRWC